MPGRAGMEAGGMEAGGMDGRGHGYHGGEAATADGRYRHRHRAILGAVLGAILGVLCLPLWLPARRHRAIHPSLCATLGTGPCPAPAIGLVVLL